jgi:hypothetical protein
MVPIHDALSEPEILETIILNLPLRHIATSRAVCREFQRIIDDTTLIQRALFLQPTSTESLVWFRRRYSNPLHPLFPVIEPDQAVRGWMADGDETKPTRLPIMNPFFPMLVTS